MQEWDGIPNDGHIPSWSGNPLFDEFAVSDGVNRARMRANRGCLGGRTGRKGRVATHLIEGFGLKSAIPLVNRVSRVLLVLERVRHGWLFLTLHLDWVLTCSVLSHGSNQLSHQKMTTHHLKSGFPDGSPPLCLGPGPSEGNEGIGPSS